MAQAKPAVTHIDDLQVYARSYKATWTKRGVIAHADLEPIQDDSRRGYQLDCFSSRESGPGKLGPRQEEIGNELMGKIRELMLTEMRAAGWNVTGYRDGKEIWKPGPTTLQVKTEVQPPVGTPERKTARRIPDRAQKQSVVQVSDQDALLPRQKLITRSTRLVTFTCQWCRQKVTEQRYPSHVPLYCSKPECKLEAKRVKTRERVAKHRRLHPDARKKKTE